MPRGDGRRGGRVEDALPADVGQADGRAGLRAREAHGAVREVGRVQAGRQRVGAEAVRRAHDGHAGQPVAGGLGPRGRRQGGAAGPGAVRQVRAVAARRAQHDAVRHGRGARGHGTAGRAGRAARRGRLAAQGRGGVQAQRRGPGRRDRGPGAARGQARRGRGQDRRQGVLGGGQGRQNGRLDDRDAGRGGRLRGMHQATARSRQR